MPKNWLQFLFLKMLHDGQIFSTTLSSVAQEAIFISDEKAEKKTIFNLVFKKKDLFSCWIMHFDPYVNCQSRFDLTWSAATAINLSMDIKFTDQILKSKTNCIKPKNIMNINLDISKLVMVGILAQEGV